VRERENKQILGEFMKTIFELAMSDFAVDQYEAVIRAKSGVLMAMGEPGTAKDAVFKSIADRNDWNYIDIRLSQIDEVEVGGMPKVISKNGVDVMSYAVPEWAIDANSKPTLIHFSELNRAKLEVRNAVLQVLNERTIGHKFSFNDTVYMCASGNLGDEDGTEVEEMDGALTNRMVFRRHNMTINEWVGNFAKDNVIEEIVSFITTNEGYFYRKGNDNDQAYASPRSWTNLSNFIKNTLGKNYDIESVKQLVSKFGNSYVGVASVKFLRWLEDFSVVSVKDVMTNFSKVKSAVEAMDRNRKEEIFSEIKNKIFGNFSEKVVKNVVSFLKLLDDDIIANYVSYSVDLATEGGEKAGKYSQRNLKILKKEFPKEFEYVVENL
jgi:hypothetical protein